MSDHYEIKLLNENVIVNNILLIQFIRKLSTPFEKWDAFEHGIIDDKGTILRKRDTLQTPQEKNSFTLFDVLILNLKKILAKIPFGSKRIATFAAALFLLKEQNNPHLKNSEYLIESFYDYVDDIEMNEVNQNDIDKIMSDFYNIIDQKQKDLLNSIHVIDEEPANSVGTGNIAGTGHDGDDPVVKKKKKKKPVKRFKDFKNY